MSLKRDGEVAKSCILLVPKICQDQPPRGVGITPEENCEILTNVALSRTIC